MEGTYPAGVPDRSTAPRGALWPFYAGGFLGPFGGGMLSSMLPELAHGLNTDTSTAGVAITAYLFPFAALMPLSGMLGARWGQARTVRRAYGLYALASVACALATAFGVFTLARAVQGAANAFTTPLLITMIADRVPPGRVGRSLGTYASMQAAGMAFAPFVGGLAAGVDYRLAFVVIALAATALALATSTSQDTARARRGAPWRPLVNRRLGQACLVAFTVQFASTGIMLLSAMEASSRFGLTPASRGLVVATFGAAGLASGRLVGALADRFGMRRLGFAATVVLACSVTAAAWPPTPGVLVLCVGVAGVAATGGRVMTSTFALLSTPANRSTATALCLSTQFLGSAIAPVLLPVYTGSVVAAFGIAGGIAAAGALLTLHRPR